MTRTKAQRQVRICHIITGLHQGGAEKLLWKLVAQSSRDKQRHHVIALRSGGNIFEEMKRQGLSVTTISLDYIGDGPRGMLELIRILRRRRPDIVQTWLYHADLLGGLAARAAFVPRIVWGLHNERLPDDVPTSTRAVFAACRSLAAVIPTQIISCSHRGAQNHIAAGYPAERMRVIENGVDADRFSLKTTKREQTRASWNVDDQNFVIGFPARLSPEKGHRNFFDAVRRVRQRIPGLRLVLCGRETGEASERLTGWLDEFGLDSVTIRLGPFSEMPSFYAASDLVCSASSSEAMPLTILEALACEKAVVATDVGDVARVLKGIGNVVPPGNPEALGHALLEVFQETAEERQRRGQRGRRLVERSYTLRTCLESYMQLYAEK